MFTSEPDRISIISSLPPLPNCDHVPISFTYSFSKFSAQRDQLIGLDWYRGDYLHINDCIYFFDSDIEFWGQYAIQCEYKLRNCLLSAIDYFIPVKEQKKNDQPWLKSVPPHFSKRADKLWKSFKYLRKKFPMSDTRVQQALYDFKQANVELKSAIHRAVSKY